MEVWWGLRESEREEGKEKEEWESVLVGWHWYIIIIKKEAGVEILKGFCTYFECSLYKDALLGRISGSLILTYILFLEES